METKQVLAQLADARGVSGHEQEMSKTISHIFSGLVDEIRIDALGSVIMYKRGSGGEASPRIMYAAHVDEIGLIVTEVEKEGFLRVGAVGGIDQRVLPSMEVVVHGRTDINGVIGAVPPHLQDPSDKGKAWKREELVVDCGLSHDDLVKSVRVGDIVGLRACLMELAGGKVAGKSFDDRAGVAVLYECARELASLDHKSHVYFVATVQEEVTYAGALTSAYSIVPDIGIAVDVTHGAIPGLRDYEGLQLDEGPGIDTGPAIHPKVFAKLKEVADDRGIPYQVEASAVPGGTDAYAIQTSRAGVATGLISIPLRYMHTTVETLALGDIKKAGRLLAYFAHAVDSEFREGLTCF